MDTLDTNFLLLNENVQSSFRYENFDIKNVQVFWLRVVASTIVSAIIPSEARAAVILHKSRKLM